MTRGSVELDLPVGVSEDQAVAWNQAWAADEGALVDAGTVTFSPETSALLEPHLGRWAGGFHVRDPPDVTRCLIDVRERLRARPGSASGDHRHGP